MTVFLHIGSPKTGTSSIQAFCAEKRAELKTASFLYPASLGKAAHTVLPLYAADFSEVYAGKRVKGVKCDADLQLYRTRWLQRFLTETEQSGCEHILVSAEHLHVSVIQEHEIARVKEFFRSLGARVVVILYLRRQDDFAASLYAERIRMGYPGTIERLLANARTVHLLDYATTVDRWTKVFGDENIILRIYDRQRLQNQDVISDLFHQIGVPSSFLSSHPPGERAEERKSLGADALAFLARFNAAVPPLIKSDEQAITYYSTNATRELIASCLASVARGRSLKLPRAIREELVKKYSQENQRIFARFDMDGFGDEILDEGGEPGDHVMTVDDAVSFAAALWVGLQREIQRTLPSGLR